MPGLSRTLIVVGTAVGLLGLIWLLAWLFGFTLSTVTTKMAPSESESRSRLVCTKTDEVQQSLGKTCIYLCSDNEKTRLEMINHDCPARLVL